MGRPLRSGDRVSLDELPLHILAVDCHPRGESADVRLVRATSPREALLALRASPVDLMLTTRRVDGDAIWSLVEKVRRVRPKLHWWLIARGIDAEEEILARTLGVTRILSAAPRLETIRLGHARASPARIELPPRPGWIDLETVRASP